MSVLLPSLLHGDGILCRHTAAICSSARPPPPPAGAGRPSSVSTPGTSSSGAASKPAWFADCHERDAVDLADPTVLQRKAKCAEVFAALNEQPVLLLRGGPGSGRTTLCRLLAQAAPAGRKVVLVGLRGLAASRQSLSEFWASAVGEPMSESLDPLAGPLRTYILDDVGFGDSYGPKGALGPDSPLWVAAKDICSACLSTCRVQLLLAGTHAPPFTPGEHTGCVLELRKPWSGRWLGLDDAELAEVFSAFNAGCASQADEASRCPPVSPRVQRAMERVCGRHVGLLRHALRLYMAAFAGTAATVSAAGAAVAAAGASAAAAPAMDSRKGGTAASSSKAAAGGASAASLRTVAAASAGTAGSKAAKAAEDEFVSVTLAAIGRESDGSTLRALNPQLSDATAAEKALLQRVAMEGDAGLPLLDWRMREAVPLRLLTTGVLDMGAPSAYEPQVLRFTSPAMRTLALVQAGVQAELDAALRSGAASSSAASASSHDDGGRAAARCAGGLGAASKPRGK